MTSDKHEPGAGRTFVQSTDDNRVMNNSTRQKYRVLTESEKTHVEKIKTLGAQFIEALHDIGDADGSNRLSSINDLLLAKIHVEDAVMRAVRHITN